MEAVRHAVLLRVLLCCLRPRLVDDEATLTVVRFTLLGDRYRPEHLPMEQKPSQERRRRYSSTR